MVWGHDTAHGEKDRAHVGAGAGRKGLAMRRTWWVLTLIAVTSAAGSGAARAIWGRLPTLRLDREPGAAGPVAVEPALAGPDLSRAVRAWREAYIAALASRRWEPLVAAGDAALGLDAPAGPAGRTFREEARQAYLGALFRARAQRDVEGMARAAESFDRLGDAEVAARARHMAGTREAR
jgi:hypothetical protein